MSSPKKKRLDVLLVDRGLYESREKAQRGILAGDVMVGTDRTVKAGTKVREDAEVHVTRQEKYVSRGAYKLEGALDHFGIDPADRVAVDLGASTGGFTDCLLQHDVRRVFCIDVGTNQLAYRIREHPRVHARERINARYLEPEDFEETPDLCVIDVSFISLTLILPAAERILAPGGDVVALVKPQFEVERGQIGKGGIVRDEVARTGALTKIRDFVSRHPGLDWQGEMESPILGTEGNTEYLAWIRKLSSG
jgi:23S rRNA (cytidine1920-2'-O)/16S rRNA (cytidine1409-2'-O)-methyltransferase